MKKYIILCQYIKSGRSKWFVATNYNNNWLKGETTYISGTTTQIKVIDVIEITEEQYQLYSKANVI